MVLSKRVEDIMKVGDLVKPKSSVLSPCHIYGIVVEPYDTPKGVWRVAWVDGGAWCSGSLCHENNMEVINESR